MPWQCLTSQSPPISESGSRSINVRLSISITGAWVTGGSVVVVGAVVVVSVVEGGAVVVAAVV